ncbi:hypothetical protein ACFO6V_26165 [Promicromonospora alba]|uniref:Uncharacterized protein n=1 Tax=Promicromonospora alba TaxID=1616110 RepID=A0ABV9HPF0_9MICO
MSPETIARSVQQLNAAGVTWPTTHRVAVTVRLAGLADVIALGDGVLEGPEAARAAFGHVLRTAGKDADPAAALREISKVQRVLSVMEQAPPDVLVPSRTRAEVGALVEPVAASATQTPATQTTASPVPDPTATSGPRALPVRPVRRADTDGPA